MKHPSEDVEQALIRLGDAITQWERTTGRQSVLIFREVGGFIHRLDSGKPVDRNYRLEPTDADLLEMLANIEEDSRNANP